VAHAVAGAGVVVAVVVVAAGAGDASLHLVQPRELPFGYFGLPNLVFSSPYFVYMPIYRPRLMKRCCQARLGPVPTNL